MKFKHTKIRVDDGVTYKTCSSCEKEFVANAESFHNSKHGKLGLSARCKGCEAFVQKQRRDNNLEEYLKKEQESRDRNREAIKERWKKHYEENKEEINAWHRKDKKENREKYREQNRKHRENNMELYRGYCQSRLAKKRTLPSNFTAKQWEESKKKFNNSCCYCGEEKELTREHFVPLSKGGEYTKNNIIPSCLSCNSSKGNKDFFEWYPQQEFYSKQREQKILKYLNYKEDKTQQLALL